MDHCQKRRLTKRCMYSAELKFLVLVKDTVEAGTSRSKTLEQEMADIGLYDTDFSLGDLVALDDISEGKDDNGDSNPNAKKTKLPEYPEPEGSDTLQEYLGQYKKAALNKKACLKACREKLKSDNVTGHQLPGYWKDKPVWTVWFFPQYVYKQITT